MFKRSNPEALQQQLEALQPKSTYSAVDEKEWKPTQDSAGNATAVIRFLPIKPNSNAKTPFVKMINHGAQINNRWYIENCTSTHGDFDSCPVCKYINENDLYNTNKTLYNKLKRKTSFWSNILVIKDPAKPENEGKVFKYRFGFKIMDKINAMVNVDTDLGETPIDVTCVFDGANFSVKLKKVGGFTNYDDCRFGSQSEIPNINDPELQQFLFDNMEDLSEIVDKRHFKSFEENEKRFRQVLGTTAKPKSLEQELDSLDEQIDQIESVDSSPKEEKQPVTQQTQQVDDIDSFLDGLDI